MISYEWGIIFLTYPPIQAALPSRTEHDEGEKKTEWERTFSTVDAFIWWKKLIISYTRTRHVIMSFTLTILFSFFFQLSGVQSSFHCELHSPPSPPIMSYSLFSSFYDTIECWNYTEKKNERKVNTAQHFTCQSTTAQHHQHRHLEMWTTRAVLWGWGGWWRFWITLYFVCWAPRRQCESWLSWAWARRWQRNSYVSNVLFVKFDKIFFEFFSSSPLSLFFRSYHVFTQATCSPLEII